MVDIITSKFATSRAVASNRVTGEHSFDPKRYVDRGKAQSLPNLVSLAADLARQGPPVDYARIAQIRQAIAAGTYEIDLAATAVSILGYDRIDSDGL